MKAAALSVAIGTGLLAVWAIGGVDPVGAGGQAIDVRTSGDLITHLVGIGDSRQQLTVVDPRQRVMGVYHIDAATGAVSLKCVRNFQYDLQLTEFNGVSPLPREIRSLVEQR